MTMHGDSHSTLSEELSDHYSSGYEARRLETGHGKIDCEGSRELLERFLPPAPAVIFDVGGGPGGYACWLARQGYEVHLIDIVPLHVQLAKEASTQQSETPLASAQIGDARALAADDETADAVLLFGPLYHLTEREDRMRALGEAHRILKPGGVFLGVGISRFASTFDGLREGFFKDPTFVEIVSRDLKDGQHRNPLKHPAYFTDAYFHHPNELKSEVSDVGFLDHAVYGVEGPSWLVPDLDDWWSNQARREHLLRIARELETEPALLGVSKHLIVVANRELEPHNQTEQVMR